MVVYGLLDSPPPLHRLWLVPLALLGGTALLGGILTALCALGFRLHHRGSLVGLVQQAAAFGRYPADLFSPSLQSLLTGIFPALLLSAVPMAWVLGHEVPPVLAVGQLGATVLAAATWAWGKGLAAYTSSGT
jgi:ABC-type uncharacterized transport system permease subunit